MRKFSGGFFQSLRQAMPTNTYSDRVNIIKYVMLDEGWRFAPLARKPNGNIRWDTVLIEGVEMRHPEGRYFIEWRHDGRRGRKSVGTIPSEILAGAQRQRAILNSLSRRRGEGTRSVRETDLHPRCQRQVPARRPSEQSSFHLRPLPSQARPVQRVARKCHDPERRSRRPHGLSGIPLQAWYGRPHGKNKTIIVVHFLKKFGVSGLLADDDWPTYTEPERETYKAKEMQLGLASGNCTSLPPPIVFLRSRSAHRYDSIRQLLRRGCAKECLPCPFISYPLQNIAFRRVSWLRASSS